MSTWQQQAEQGDADAAWKLAAHYLQKPIAYPEKAFYWAAKADKAGSADGAVLHGVCCYEGIGTERNETKAAECFMRAAQRGNTRVLKGLACLYAEGSCVPKDVAKAKEMLTGYLKAYPDDGEAYFTLAAVMNETASTCEETAAVFRTLKKAADSGVKEAYAPMANAYYNGIGVEKNVEAAVEYTRKAADAGEADGLVSLAAFYYRGTGVDKDIEKARSLCREAIEKAPDNSAAYRNLAVMLKDDVRNDRDRAELENLFLCAAERGDVDCMVELAWEYTSDTGNIKVCRLQALHWCEQALKARPDDAELRCLLADNLRRAGKVKKAFAQYTRAAGQKYPQAVYRLGRAHEEGRAFAQGKQLPAIRDEAAKLYLQALEYGSPEAGAALVRMLDLGYAGVALSREDYRDILLLGAGGGVKGCAACLASYYHPQEGAEPDVAKYRQWMQIAVKRDATPWALTMRAFEIMQENEDTAPAMKEAAELLRRAADAGYPMALVGLGMQHLKEKGPLPYNPGKSIELFRRAARQGEALGAEAIADMCAEGSGVRKNRWLARQWRRYARSIEYRQRDKKESLIELPD